MKRGKSKVEVKVKGEGVGEGKGEGKGEGVGGGIFNAEKQRRRVAENEEVGL